MITYRSLNEVSLIDFVSLVNEIFSDYPLPVNWDVLGFRLDARENSLSMDESFVFFEGTKPVGFVVTGIRKSRGRIDAMGVVREKRGTGLAQMILRHALERLKWHGVERVILEVASNDPRALRFYQKNGFREIRELHTLALKRDNTVGSKGARFFKTDPRWVHRVAIEAELSLPRRPNWQREALTLLLSDGRYRMERVVLKGKGEGYLVWGTTEDSAFIVDTSPISDRSYYTQLLEASVHRIFEETSKPVITITAVPEDDPLYETSIGVGFRSVFEQKEMCFRLPA